MQRLSDREFSNRDLINEFLDHESFAYVGFIESSTHEPFVIPMSYALNGIAPKLLKVLRKVFCEIAPLGIV